MQKTYSINLNLTINSGQVFLWDRVRDTWFGIDGEDLIVIQDVPFKIISSSGKINRFFREDDNLDKILSEISKDGLVKSAVKRFNGLRLMRQDPFQCYISFICSSNSSIQNIRRMLKNLCKKFGNEIEFDKKQFFTFPKPEKLSNASNRELLSCGLGFRAKYVKQAAKMANLEKINFELLRKENYKAALETLKTVPGIGNKVADCILLFSLDRIESFPLDRWTQRILQKYYSKIFPDMQERSLTEKRYLELHEKIAEYFGPYAGYSQQFLFKMERDLNKKSWL
ncbi:MAG: DNA-3-methyladenine glycosylase family protein [Nitrosotalea sp.]